MVEARNPSILPELIAGHEAALAAEWKEGLVGEAFLQKPRYILSPPATAFSSPRA